MNGCFTLRTAPPTEGKMTANITRIHFSQHFENPVCSTVTAAFVASWSSLLPQSPGMVAKAITSMTTARMQQMTARSATQGKRLGASGSSNGRRGGSPIATDKLSIASLACALALLSPERNSAGIALTKPIRDESLANGVTVPPASSGGPSGIASNLTADVATVMTVRAR